MLTCEILYENGGYTLAVRGGGAEKATLYRDITRRRGEIERLAALLRRHDIGPEAARDIVEDFLACGGSTEGQDGEGDVPRLTFRAGT